MNPTSIPRGWKPNKKFTGEIKSKDIWDRLTLDQSFDSIQFSLLGPEEIRRMSVVRIFETGIYDKNLPHPFGILDHRMGSTDRRILCGTCGNGLETCPGHPGHIELPFPMFHVGYFDIVLKILRSTCFWCSRLLIASDETKLKAAYHLAGLKMNEAGEYPEQTPYSERNILFPFEKVEKGETGPPKSKRGEDLFVSVMHVSKGKKCCDFCHGPQPTKYTKYQHGKCIQIHCEWNSELGEAERIVRTHRDIFFDSVTQTPEEFWKKQGFASGTPNLTENPTFLGPHETLSTILVEGHQDDFETNYANDKKSKKVRKNKQKKEQEMVEKKNKDNTPLKRFVRIYKTENKPLLECDDERKMVKRVFSQLDVYNILKKISDDDCYIMGLNPKHSRPENMMMTVLLVGPPIIRPSIAVSEGSRAKGQDDMTHKLQYILKSIIPLQKQLELEKENVFDFTGCGPSVILQRYIDELQYHVATLINNDIRGLKQATQRSGAPMKSITGRLKGKRGRIRENMMGKRVDFSARSTVSPECAMAVDEVGIPESFATKLTISEVVKSDNIHELTRMVRLGPDHPEGAVEVHDNRGLVTDLAMATVRDSLSLEIGWIVERRLRNGDYVIVNRQPSLHKPSMMAHRVKIMSGKTIRLHPSATPPYNADFDGDEMNIHVPRSLAARIEAETIICVPNQIITPQSNKPVFSVVQDGISGTYLLTRMDTFLTKIQAMDLVMKIMESPGAGKLGPKSPFYRDITLPTPAILKPKPLWTGKQIFSLLLPDSFFLEKCTRGLKPEQDESHLLDEKERAVVVKNGELLCGALCKQTLGSATCGFIHRLALDYTCDRSARFLTDVHVLSNGFLSIRGLSIGMSDCVISKDASMRISRALKACDKSITHILQKSRENGISDMDMEPTIKSNLDNILSVAGKIVQGELNDKNRFHVMVLSGAKGSIVNETQVMGCVGQTSVEGKRVCSAPGTRLLPSIKHGDDSPGARGLVSTNYADGLLPDENFLHAMAAREGLVDTAVKTAETGYQQRRLIKGMETLSQKHDNTIRNSAGDIVQFSYGNDGYDATFIEPASLDSLHVADMQQKYGASPFLPLISFVQYCKKDAILSKNHILFSQWNTTVYIPFNIKHLIDLARQRTIKEQDRLGFVEPLDMNHVYGLMRKTCQELAQRSSVGAIVQDPSYILDAHIKQGMSLFEIPDPYAFAVTSHMRNHLFLGIVYSEIENNISKKAFEWMMEQVISRHQRALVQPGEMVGAIAAQSLAAPIMQMTLNSFHSAGLTTKAVTSGVPRVKELIDVCKKPSNRSMTVTLHPLFSQSEAVAKSLQVEMEHKLLRDVVHVAEVVYDPIEKEQYCTLLRPSRFVISIELDKIQMHHFNLLPYKVADMVETFFQSQQEFVDAVQEVLVHESEKESKNTIPLEKIRVSDVQVFSKHTNSQIEQTKDARYDDVWMMTIRLALVQDMVEREGLGKKVPNLFPVGDQFQSGGNEGASGLDMERSILQKVTGIILNDIHLGGFESIQKAFVSTRKVDVWQEINNSCDTSTRTEYMIETNGSSLEELMPMDSIVWEETICNDVYETYEVLGIEAAVSVLFHEIYSVLTADGSFISARHPLLLADTMTFRGKLMPMTRHGINRVGAGPLEEASFEETTDRLFNASAFSAIQEIKGVTPNVMIGRIGDFGTGIVHVIPEPDYMHALDEMHAKAKNPNLVKTRIPIQGMTTKVEMTGVVDDLSWLDEEIDISESELNQVVQTILGVHPIGSCWKAPEPEFSQFSQQPQQQQRFEYNSSQGVSVDLGKGPFIIPLSSYQHSLQSYSKNSNSQGDSFIARPEKKFDPKVETITVSHRRDSYDCEEEDAPTQNLKRKHAQVRFKSPGIDGNDAPKWNLSIRNPEFICVASPQKKRQRTEIDIPWKTSMYHRKCKVYEYESEHLYSSMDSTCSGIFPVLSIAQSDSIMEAYDHFYCIQHQKSQQFVLQIGNVFDKNEVFNSIEHLVRLVYLMNGLYEKVILVKPFSSRPCSTELFLVGKQKRDTSVPTLISEAWIDFIETRNSFGLEQAIPFDCIPATMIENVLQYMTKFTRFQTNHLTKALELTKSTDLGSNVESSESRLKTIVHAIRHAHKNDPVALERARLFCAAHGIPTIEK